MSISSTRNKPAATPSRNQRSGSTPQSGALQNGSQQGSGEQGGLGGLRSFDPSLGDTGAYGGACDTSSTSDSGSCGGGD